MGKRRTGVDRRTQDRSKWAAPTVDVHRPKFTPWRRRGRTGVPGDHFPKVDTPPIRSAMKRVRAEQARRAREA